jgi:hypothetical protein
VEGVERIVLEQHIGADAGLRDGPGHPSERIGGPQHQAEEEGRHHVDDHRRPRNQRIAGPVAEAPHHGGGVRGQDERPQQDRSGQRRPQTGDRVEQWGVGAVVGGDEGDREVVDDQGVLHGGHREDPAEEHDGRVHLAAADGRHTPPGQAGGDDHDAGHGGHEPEQDAGVAECGVHRGRPVARPLTADPPIIASSRSVP